MIKLNPPKLIYFDIWKTPLKNEDLWVICNGKALPEENTICMSSKGLVFMI